MYEYKCSVTKVVDGDTIDVDIDLGFDVVLRNQRIRLNGIDTPETRTRDLVEKEFGFYVTEVVKNFINGGPAILKTTDYNPTGKYGRIIGDLFVNGVSLCAYLIENYYAILYQGSSKDVVKEQHYKNLEILKERGEI